MRSGLLRALLFLSMVLGARGAAAAISCSISSSGFNSVYSSTAPSANDTQGSVTVSCIRNDPANDPTTLGYTLRADNGVNAQAGASYAITGGGGGPNRVQYELYRDAAFSTLWSTTLFTSISGTVNFGSASTTVASDTQTFYARIPAQQNVHPRTFVDTVTLTLCSSLGVCALAPFGTTGILGVSVVTSSSCQLSTPPASITFNYTSFQTTVAMASSTYAVRCTNGTSYQASLDATTGTLLGLSYSLSLGTPGTVSGNGMPQVHTIGGTIAAGQSGTCAAATCTQTEQRVLTITY